MDSDRKSRKRAKSSESKKHPRKNKAKSKPPKKKHKHHYATQDSEDSDLSSISSDSSSSPSPPRYKKHKHSKKDIRKKKKKRKEKHQHAEPTGLHIAKQPITSPVAAPLTVAPSTNNVSSTDIAKLKASLAAQTAKPRGPMTHEEYEKQQSVVRRVYDPDTGRHRLVKGDGEIIEEIVSRERQKAINKQATLGDGYSFQAQMKKLL